MVWKLFKKNISAANVLMNNCIRLDKVEAVKSSNYVHPNGFYGKWLKIYKVGFSD